MKLSRAAELVGGVLVGGNPEFSRVGTDTRALAPGDLFVALRGERFDGHDFLGEAVKAGAVGAVVARDTGLFASYVRVDDTRRALGLLAAGWADRFPARRVAVTGNAGKTTVKEMIACMLGEDVLATRGNLNNDIGVPLTLLALGATHRFGVFELGANAPGEIAWTASLVRPEAALITNVTGAHLEGFGSMQGIADAKAEIFSGVRRGGVAVINREDHFADYFTARALGSGLKPVYVGFQPDVDLRATEVRERRDGVDFALHVEQSVHPVSVPLPGRHQVLNALMAIAMVRALGEDLAVALPRLAALHPVKGRMNLSGCLGGTLVDDSYNANPGSVKAAIDWLCRQDPPRVLVLGGLAELGKDSERIHRELGEYGRRAGLDMVLATRPAAPVLAGYGDGVMVGDAADAARRAAAFLRAGGTVLVKGSRSARMDAVVDALKNMGEPD